MRVQYMDGSSADAVFPGEALEPERSAYAFQITRAEDLERMAEMARVDIRRFLDVLNGMARALRAGETWSGGR